MVTPGGQRGGGRVLARRYHLQRVLGRGAMGAVWEAEDTFLRRTVAVKEVVLPGSLSPEERAVSCERTLREARAIARLGHPNVVTLFDVLDEDSRPWVVMELVPSRSLAEVIKEDGPLHPLRVATVGLAILGALEAAHAAGITHRDVKPGNILLGHDGRVKLTDFGIARAAGDDTITGTGLLVGSPSYIAPEIVKGQEAGAPADLWGLGATLYAAVEGRAPFSGGDAMETLSKVVQEPPAPYVRAGALKPALAGMLDKDPDRRSRPVDARRQLLDVLRGGNEAEPPPAPPRTAAAPQPAARPEPPPAPSGPALADLLVPVWRQTGSAADDRPEGAGQPAVATDARAAGPADPVPTDPPQADPVPAEPVGASADPMPADPPRAATDPAPADPPYASAAAVATDPPPAAATAVPTDRPRAAATAAGATAEGVAGAEFAASTAAAGGGATAAGAQPAGGRTSVVGSETAERAREALAEEALIDPDVAGPDLLDGDLDGETRAGLIATPDDGRERAAAEAPAATGQATGTDVDAPAAPGTRQSEATGQATGSQGAAATALPVGATAADRLRTGPGAGHAAPAADRAAPAAGLAAAAAGAAADPSGVTYRIDPADLTGSTHQLEPAVETDPSERTVTIPVDPRPAYGVYGGAAPDSELPTQRIAPLPFGGPNGPGQPARAFRADPIGRPLDFGADRPPADRRRRTVGALLAAVALLLVVLLGVGLLARQLGRGDGGGGGDPGGATASAPARIPSGYTPYKGSGFTVAVPAGWPSAVQREGVVDIREPRTTRFLRLITVDSSSSALEQLTVAERQFQGDPTYQAYERVRLGKVDYRGLDAADWEFTFTLSGVRRHVVYRGIVTDGRTYGLYLSTPDRNWAASRSVFQTAADTFRTG